MESGNTAVNLKLLGWRTLEERRIDNKLGTLKKGFLGKIDIPTDRLKLILDRPDDAAVALFSRENTRK